MGDKPRELTQADLRRACLPERYWHVTLGQIPTKCEYAAVMRRYVDHIQDRIGKGTGLLFHGPYRTGKTSAASIVLKAALAYRYSGCFLRVGELVDSVFERWTWSDGVRSLPMRHRIVEVDVLVLDDLSAERNRDALPPLFEEIVRERFDRRRTTLLTTNLSFQTLTERFTNVFPVLQECMVPVKVAGTNWHSENVNELEA